MIPVQVLGVHGDPSSGATLVLLGDGNRPDRVLPIFIGLAEAQAIVVGLSGVELPRPGTHDLLITMFEAADASLSEVRVTELRDGVFIAEVEAETPAGQQVISARPSDAIALAVRRGVQVFVAGSVFEEASVEISHDMNQPFTEEEVEDIVSDFQDFLATAQPDDFRSDPDDG